MSAVFWPTTPRVLWLHKDRVVPASVLAVRRDGVVIQPQGNRIRVLVQRGNLRGVA